MRGIPLAITEGMRSAGLGKADAHGDLGAFTVTVTVPDGFVRGPAIVTAYTDEAPVTLP